MAALSTHLGAIPEPSLSRFPAFLLAGPVHASAFWHVLPEHVSARALPKHSLVCTVRPVASRRSCRPHHASSLASGPASSQRGPSRSTNQTVSALLDVPQQLVRLSEPGSQAARPACEAPPLPAAACLPPCSQCHPRPPPVRAPECVPWLFADSSVSFGPQLKCHLFTRTSRPFVSPCYHVTPCRRLRGAEGPGVFTWLFLAVHLFVPCVFIVCSCYSAPQGQSSLLSALFHPRGLE